MAATGALFAGATSLGAGTAAAAPVPEAPAAGLPFPVPEGLIPAGFEMPTFAPPELAPPELAIPDTSDLPGMGLPDVGAAAQQWLDSVGVGGEGALSPLDGLQALRNQTVQPVSGVLTSNYGARWGTHHSGIDIAAPIGTPVYSAADGVVTAAGPASGFGLWVKVLHDDGVETVYGHVDDYSVGEGQRVAAGQQIATVGNRGQSTGPHLHFEVHDVAGTKVDPAQWLATRGVAPTWSGVGLNA